MNQLDTALPTGPVGAAPGRARLIKTRLTKTRLTKTASIAVLALTLGACNALNRLSEVGQEPPLTAIQNPAVLHGNQLARLARLPQGSARQRGRRYPDGRHRDRGRRVDLQFDEPQPDRRRRRLGSLDPRLRGEPGPGFPDRDRSHQPDRPRQLLQYPGRRQRKPR